MSDLRDAVLQLGDLDRRDEAVRVILGAGDSAIPYLREGYRHPHWRVRHMSCRLLDDLPLDADTLVELRQVARNDPNKRVRRQAWHAITCEPCKPDGAELSCDLDPLSATAEELRDRSLRVRRGGATGLLFAAVTPGTHVDRLRALIATVLATETDRTIVSRAVRALAVLDGR